MADFEFVRYRKQLSPASEGLKQKKKKLQIIQRVVVWLFRRGSWIDQPQLTFRLDYCNDHTLVKGTTLRTFIMAEVDFSKVYSATYSNVGYMPFALG